MTDRKDFDYWILDVRLPSTGEIVRSRLPDWQKDRPPDGSEHETHGEAGIVVGAKKHRYERWIVVPGGRPTGQEG